jgi:hypothetical protein
MVLACAAALCLFACRTAPLYQPDHVAHGAPAGATLEQVAKSIREAGFSLGWAMREEGPGLIRGVLDRRRHRAEVEVSFDTQQFSIRHVASENLRYEAAEGTIHKGYNQWVLNLERRIIQRTGLIAN